MTDLKKHPGLPLVYVQWADSIQPTSAWQWISEPQPKVVHCTTVGQVLRETSDELVMALSVGWSAENKPDQATGVMAIPKRSIVRRVNVWPACPLRVPASTPKLKPASPASALPSEVSSAASKPFSPPSCLSSHPSPSALSVEPEALRTESALAVNSDDWNEPHSLTAVRAGLETIWEAPPRTLVRAQAVTGRAPRRLWVLLEEFPSELAASSAQASQMRPSELFAPAAFFLRRALRATTAQAITRLRARLRRAANVNTNDRSPA